MKHFTLLLTLITFSCFGLNAGILTVSNNGFVPAQYTTIQDAVDAAISGDTIYVSGSATAYSSVTIRKPLTLIGAGYDANFLSSAYSTSTGTIQLGYDTTNGTEASGSTFIGLSVSDYIYNYTGAYEYGIDDITVRNCNVGISIIQYSNGVNSCSNWLIEHNVTNRIGWTGGQVNANTIENCVIRNNVIIGYVQTMSNGSCIIDHNLFLGTSTKLSDIQNLVISNNIFVRGTISSSVNFNMFVNNIYSNQNGNPTFFETGNNDGIDNIYLPTYTDVLFVDYPVNGGFDTSYDFHLQAGSPAIGEANDGTDIGIYGGVSPFPASFGGQPSGIPTVESLEILNPQLGTNCNLQFQSTGEVNP